MKYSVSVFFVLVLVLIAGCSPRQEDGGAQSKSAQEEVVQGEPLGEQVVAVARLLRFNERHFDLRAWRAQALESGQLIYRDDPALELAEMPTAYFRLFLDELLGEQANLIRWDGHLDVVVWEPGDDGQWRWAVSIPRFEGEALSARVDWVGEGRFYIQDGPGAKAELVYRRQWEGEPERIYYVSEIDTPAARGGTYKGRALTVANFPEGAVRVGEAVGQTGDSGLREAELYVWPRRWGIDERYLQAAKVMEQQIAMNGHDLLPARVGLLQLQTQLYRALGNKHAWPKIIRVSAEVDRSATNPEGRRLALSIDVPAHQGNLLPALWRSMRETNLEEGPQIAGAEGQIGLILRPRELSTLASAVLPESWLQLMSVRGAGTRELLIEEFERLLLHNRGPTRVGFYKGPRELTGEIFVGWQALDREELMSAATYFHHRLLRDYWMPLFDVAGLPESRDRVELFGGEEVEMRSLTFTLPGGGEEAGVCWLIRGREYLSYYGVEPCRRLREAADRPEESFSGPALAYQGSFKGLIDTVWILPGDHSATLFEGLNIEVRTQRFGDRRLALDILFTDLGEVAQLVDELPRLKRNWAPALLFDPGQIILELSLQQSTYQEPALSALGVPGMPGVFPPSFLLGMPFSFGPTSPTLFRNVYFGPEEAEDAGL